MNLLSRDEFRESVFKRDGNLCVYCKAMGKDAHHIMERRLFDNGGYDLFNGATLCADCHIKAEQTLLSCDEIRRVASIDKIILPDHLYPDYSYTKWGDILNPNGTRYKGELFFDENVQKILASAGVLSLYSNYFKYPRSYHLPFSPGKTDDDKIIKDINTLLSKPVVVTIKMDGENCTGYSDGYIHARSLDSNNHISRNWVKNYLSDRLFELPDGWRICGENLYAKHSIHYSNLESYFYLFSIWNEKNECLSWEETKLWANLLDIQIVPEISSGLLCENDLKTLYTPTFKDNQCEGFVVRWQDKFNYSNFRKALAKYVRQGHVNTNKHWIKTKIVPNLLK